MILEMMMMLEMMLEIMMLEMMFNMMMLDMMPEMMLMLEIVPDDRFFHDDDVPWMMMMLM